MIALRMGTSIKEQRGSLAQTLFDVTGDFFTVLLVDQRTHERLRIERVARCEGCCMSLHRL
ncbi:hypothetical protein D3C80_2209490 [compost metagenome]